MTGAGIADEDPFIAAVKFDRDGLVPVIAVDVDTGVVRMFAFATAEALRATQTTGDATFYSRSRGKLWRKGEESGNTMPVREIRLDCDGDAVLYLCQPVGPTCHTGQVSCFFRKAEPTASWGPSKGPHTPPRSGSGGQSPPPPTREDAAIPTTLVEDGGPPEVPAAILSRLAKVIAGRRNEPPDKSYVSSLLAKGLPKINAKITEEAGEVAEALVEGDRAHITHEAADVIFHLMVGLEAAGVKVEDVFAELRRRFGVGGHVEKAGREPKP